MTALIGNKKNQFNLLTAQLDGASPLQALNRGYALITTEDDRSIKSVKKIKKRSICENKIIGRFFYIQG